MRADANDKQLISRQMFNAGQALEGLHALVTFALFQAERAEPLEFMQLQTQWEAMLRMMKEKIECANESTGEAAYIADTCVPNEETAH